MANVAAPLLAGFSITAIAAVSASSDKFRWPGAALLALTLAAILLVTSLQFGFRARSYLYSGEDVASWWTRDEMDRRLENLAQTQRDDFELWMRWSARARGAYNLGIVVLAIGIAAVLAPPHSTEQSQAAFRWIAAAFAAVGALGEFCWGTIPVVNRRLQLRRMSRNEMHSADDGAGTTAK
jgi:hypothetical protein